MNEVKDKLEVKMNFASAQDHVPEAEWNNRMTKEQRLAMNQVSQLNLFPFKGGISTLQQALLGTMHRLPFSTLSWFNIPHGLQL